MNRRTVLRIHLLDFVDAIVDDRTVTKEVIVTRNPEIVDVSVMVFDAHLSDSIQRVVGIRQGLKAEVVASGNVRSDGFREPTHGALERSPVAVREVVQGAPERHGLAKRTGSPPRWARGACGRKSSGWVRRESSRSFPEHASPMAARRPCRSFPRFDGCIASEPATERC